MFFSYVSKFGGGSLVWNGRMHSILWYVTFKLHINICCGVEVRCNSWPIVWSILERCWFFSVSLRHAALLESVLGCGNTLC